MLVIAHKINLSKQYSGTDSPEDCVDKKHFAKYGKEITYQYNSRGFRDDEWPADVSESICCIGDSCTLGIGQPFSETWPQLLQERTGTRCVNLGEDGCSNDSIALRTKQVVEQYNFKHIVVMWSYFWRRRVGDTNVHHDKENFGVKEDIDNFKANFETVNALGYDNIIHSLIPNALVPWDKSALVPNSTEYILSKTTSIDTDKIIHFEQVDFARDGLHFDIQTSRNFVDMVTYKLTNGDK